MATLEAFRFTKEDYEEKYGEEWVPLEVMPTMGPSMLCGCNLDTVVWRRRPSLSGVMPGPTRSPGSTGCPI